MATYNSLIVRSEVAMAEDRIPEIFKLAQEGSVVMSNARKLRNARKDELKLRVASELPVVYWVDEPGKTSTYPNTTLKQTTSAAWTDVTLYLRELAAIVPIAANVLDDEDFDILGELKQEFADAIAKEIDRVVLVSADNAMPDDFPSSIMTGMPAGHKISHATFSGDYYDELLGVDGVFSQVEQDGYEVTGMVGSLRLKGLLRGLRDGSTGVPIFAPSMAAGIPGTVSGVPTDFSAHIPDATALAIAGDWNQLVWTIAQDIKFDVFDTGVIQDGNGAIQHNLMQEDKVALRVTFRFGFALPVPATYTTVSGIQYPFAALTA